MKQLYYCNRCSVLHYGDERLDCTKCKILYPVTGNNPAFGHQVCGGELVPMERANEIPDSH